MRTFVYEDLAPKGTSADLLSRVPHLAGASLEAPFFLGPLFYVAIGRQIST